MTRWVDSRALRSEVAATLNEALSTEYQDAIKRSQSFLVAIAESRLPTFLSDDANLGSVDADDMRAAIVKWAGLCEGPLHDMRTDTDICAYYGEEMSEAAQIDYCSRTQQAESGLRASLYRKFFPDLAP